MDSLPLWLENGIKLMRDRGLSEEDIIDVLERVKSNVEVK